MRYFLAIAPPHELEQTVLRFRTDWKLGGIDPHITVKAPCGLGDAQKWLPAVQQFCQRLVPPFVRVGITGLFDSAILYLRVDSPQLVAIHQHLLTLLATSVFDQEACFEGVRYVPHLTVAHLDQLNTQQAAEVAQAATLRFTGVAGYRAKSLDLYGKAEDEPYRQLTCIPFGSS